MGEFREVDFYGYCKNCKHYLKEGYDDPCNDCLLIGIRAFSKIPFHYEKAETSKSKKKKK